MNIDEFNFKLTAAERASPLWNRVRAQLESRLASQRRKNDLPQGADETALLRGEISCLKSILDFGVDPPPTFDEGGEAGTQRARPATRRE